MLLHVVFENLNSHVWVIYLQVKHTWQSLTLPLTHVLAISFAVCRLKRIWSIDASKLLLFFPLSLLSPTLPLKPPPACKDALLLLI